MSRGREHCSLSWLMSGPAKSIMPFPGSRNGILEKRAPATAMTEMSPEISAYRGFNFHHSPSVRLSVCLSVCLLLLSLLLAVSTSGDGSLQSAGRLKNCPPTDSPVNCSKPVTCSLDPQISRHRQGHPRRIRPLRRTQRSPSQFSNKQSAIRLGNRRSALVS